MPPVSAILTFVARSEETWICSCTPTNQTQPRVTATRESISPVKIPSTASTVQRLLFGAQHDAVGPALVQPRRILFGAAVQMEQKP